jgi:hypothetical protein
MVFTHTKKFTGPVPDVRIRPERSGSDRIQNTGIKSAQHLSHTVYLYLLNTHVISTCIFGTLTIHLQEQRVGVTVAPL